MPNGPVLSERQNLREIEAQKTVERGLEWMKGKSTSSFDGILHDAKRLRLNIQNAEEALKDWTKFYMRAIQINGEKYARELFLNKGLDISTLKPRERSQYIHVFQIEAAEYAAFPKDMSRLLSEMGELVYALILKHQTIPTIRQFSIRDVPELKREAWSPDSINDYVSTKTKTLFKGFDSHRKSFEKIYEKKVNKVLEQVAALKVKGEKLVSSYDRNRHKNDRNAARYNYLAQYFGQDGLFGATVTGALTRDIKQRHRQAQERFSTIENQVAEAVTGTTERKTDEGGMEEDIASIIGGYLAQWITNKIAEGRIRKFSHYKSLDWRGYIRDRLKQTNIKKYIFDKYKLEEPENKRKLDLYNRLALDKKFDARVLREAASTFKEIQFDENEDAQAEETPEEQAPESESEKQNLDNRLQAYTEKMKPGVVKHLAVLAGGGTHIPNLQKVEEDLLRVLSELLKRDMNDEEKSLHLFGSLTFEDRTYLQSKWFDLIPGIVTRLTAPYNNQEGPRVDSKRQARFQFLYSKLGEYKEKISDKLSYKLEEWENNHRHEGITPDFEKLREDIKLLLQKLFADKLKDEASAETLFGGPSTNREKSLMQSKWNEDANELAKNLLVPWKLSMRAQKNKSSDVFASKIDPVSTLSVRDRENVQRKSETPLSVRHLAKHAFADNARHKTKLLSIRDNEGVGHE